MSLTPKNWERFQHYGNRQRPPWIKLHKTLLDDYAFFCLPVASRALAPWLWLLASEYKDGGITASLVEIAHRLRIHEEELRGALKPLIEKGFFIDASNMLAACKQGASPDKEEEEDKDREEKVSLVRFSQKNANEAFEAFWKAYPKREGANPKQTACKAFAAALKAGATEQEIVAGAERYRKDPATKVGTPFVTQAVTWLHQKRWTDYPETNLAAKNGNGGGFYAKPESPQLEAWDAHRKANGGIAAPRDAAGGWHFPTEWPPGQTPAEKLKRDLMAGLE